MHILEIILKAVHRGVKMMLVRARARLRRHPEVQQAAAVLVLAIVVAFLDGWFGPPPRT